MMQQAHPCYSGDFDLRPSYAEGFLFTLDLKALDIGFSIPYQSMWVACLALIPIMANRLDLSVKQNT